MSPKEHDLAFRLQRTEALRVELAGKWWGHETLLELHPELKKAYTEAERSVGR